MKHTFSCLINYVKIKKIRKITKNDCQQKKIIKTPWKYEQVLLFSRKDFENLD